MPTPASGAISLSQVNSELQKGSNLGAYRGQTFWTPEGSQRTISQAPSLNEMRNLQKNAPASPLSRHQVYEIGLASFGGTISIAYRPRTGELWVDNTNGVGIGHWYAVSLVNPYYYQSLSINYSVLGGSVNLAVFNINQGQGTGSPDDYNIIGFGLPAGTWVGRIDFTGNPK